LHADLNPRNSLFLVLLMSLVIIRFDRYRSLPARRISHATHMVRLHPATAGSPFGLTTRLAAERTA
jgi:hypothetical protein